MRAKRKVSFINFWHCFVTLSTEVRKWPPKTDRWKSPISENWPSFGRLDGRLTKSPPIPNQVEIFSHSFPGLDPAPPNPMTSTLTMRLKCLHPFYITNSINFLVPKYNPGPVKEGHWESYVSSPRISHNDPNQGLNPDCSWKPIFTVTYHAILSFI